MEKSCPFSCSPNVQHVREHIQGPQISLISEFSIVLYGTNIFYFKQKKSLKRISSSDAAVAKIKRLSNLGASEEIKKYSHNVKP